MRYIYGSAANEFKDSKGKPILEIVLHSFEGETALEGKRNLQEWRFFSNPENLRAIAGRLIEIADEAEAEVQP